MQPCSVTLVSMIGPCRTPHHDYFSPVCPCIPPEFGSIQAEGPQALCALLEDSLLLQVITCKPDLLVPANPVILDGVADLTGLTYLNEPSILHGLNLRYSEDLIYTHAGPVLIAINPFKQVSSA